MQSPVSRIGYLALIVFAVAWAFYILRGPNGVPGWLQKRQRIQQLEDRNREMARQLELRREGIKTLEDYVPAQELEIRKRLKLVKPDEKIYVIGQ
ncbi:MAG: FtsB family cell division protein [Bryobacteraceae bacterium]